MNRELVQEITIPEYIIKVQLSKKRRKKYYSKRSKKKWTYKKLGKRYKPIKDNHQGPPYKLDAPKTKILKQITGNYQWKSGYLCNENGDRLIANKQSAGTPNYEKLSGNSFASGYGSPHIRATLVNGLKRSYYPHLTNVQKMHEFPLWVEWHLYTTIPKRLFDLSNFWFYYKYFEDCLTEWSTSDGNGNRIFHYNSRKKGSKQKAQDQINQKSHLQLIEPIIPDDNIKYVSKPGNSPILHPIDNWEDRKFVFKFYKDQRECITNHKFYE